MTQNIVTFILKMAKRTLLQISLLVITLNWCKSEPKPQLDLPQISSTQRNPYNNFGISSTPSSINSPGNQFSQNSNFNYGSPSPNTPGVYPVSSTPYNRGINPDINNNGYPSLDYGNGLRNPVSSTSRPYDDRNRDDRIDINNDPNFRRNDPNFVRNDPNYAGANPYDFNRGNPDVPGTNHIDDRFHQVNLQQIREFLVRADEKSSKECTNNVAAQWNFETDVNDATQHSAVSNRYICKM